MSSSCILGWRRSDYAHYLKNMNPAKSLLLKTGFILLLKIVGPGVGRIGVIDHDTVEVSNLHRQVLHTQSRIGVSKAASLAASLAEINSSIEVVVTVMYPRRRNSLL